MLLIFFFFQAEDGIRDIGVTGVQTCALPILQHADLSERPSQKEYGKYFWLAEHYRDRGCDDTDGQDRFVAEDPTFNALWATSEEALARIAEVAGADPEPHLARAAAITAALDRLYDDALGLYVARAAL